VPILSVVFGVIATGRLVIAKGKDLYGEKSKSHMKFRIVDFK
jgi:hypothetical protein